MNRPIVIILLITQSFAHFLHGQNLSTGAVYYKASEEFLEKGDLDAAQKSCVAALNEFKKTADLPNWF
ncbi:MAG: hypothetical protein Q7T20_14390, partial [Saprospiraceae bacterium]|nr:hypothetical protein [Saprospiraceae bacterium]